MQSANENTVLIDRLVEAYNSSNARAFSDLFAADALVYEFPGTLAQQSREAIFEFYQKLFGEFPENQTEVLHRIVIGNRVADHERVRRAPDAEPFEVLTIYELENGEIKRVDFIRQ
jgi:uncharacterized protein (TIGR02246 family)